MMFSLNEGTYLKWDKINKWQDFYLNGTVGMLVDSGQQIINNKPRRIVVQEDYQTYFDSLAELFHGDWFDIFLSYYTPTREYFNTFITYIHWLFLDPNSQVKENGQTIAFVCNFETDIKSTFDID